MAIIANCSVGYGFEGETMVVSKPETKLTCTICGASEMQRDTGNSFFLDRHRHNPHSNIIYGTELATRLALKVKTGIPQMPIAEFHDRTCQYLTRDKASAVVSAASFNIVGLEGEERAVVMGDEILGYGLIHLPVVDLDLIQEQNA